ncbi:AI-2E family transporter [Leptolyngbya sp. BC1307]|uniref:AI-2E family transporter n=1 Tax=Leptolyngbya sp. BC1307 TaxID=2029589 RepID=UPI000EFDB131|nr:AI-2E family transporter [Leptolyngbya sp. BC1307]
MASEQRLSISLSGVLVVFAAITTAIIGWQLRGLLLLVMISVVLACSIAPIVNWAEQYRVPRWLSAVLTYLAIIGTLVGVAVLIGPTVLEQIQLLVRQLPVLLRKAATQIEVWVLALNDSRPDLTDQVFGQLDVQAIAAWAIRSTRQVALRSYNLTADILGTLLSLVLAIFISGYMLADSRTLTTNFVRLIPAPWDQRVSEQLPEIASRIGSYIRGRVLVSGTLALITGIGLSFLGLKDFAIGLGAIAGVTNLIPFLGPILGAIPALLVAIPLGGWAVLWLVIFYAIIQNIETYLLDPLLVGSSVGVHPLYQLLAVLGGAQVLGIVGALIVPPWVAGGAVLIEALYLQPKLKAEEHPELIV